MMLDSPYISVILELMNTVEDQLLALSPYDESNQGRYLAYRSVGFGRNMAMKLTGIAKITLYKWRQNDLEFRETEDKLKANTTDRKKYSLEFILADFCKNFIMVLEKDARLIKQSLDKPGTLNVQDNSYLLKARQLYTNQQFHALLEAMGGDGEDGDYTEMIMRIRQVTRIKQLESKEEVIEGHATEVRETEEIGRYSPEYQEGGDLKELQPPSS